MNNISSFLHFFNTKTQTGIQVEKNRLEGKPITVLILLSFNSLVLIRCSAPLLNKTPLGKIIAILPSSLK